MADMLKEFLYLMASIWGGTEVLPRVLPFLKRLNKDQLALILGILFGTGAAGLHWIGLPGDPTGWQLYLGGAFGGFLATVTAGAVHDKGVTPIKAAFTKKG